MAMLMMKRERKQYKQLESQVSQRLQQVLDETDKNAVGDELDASSTEEIEGEPELANNVSTAAFIAGTIEKLQSQSGLERRSKLSSIES